MSLLEVNEALPEYKRYSYSDYCTWGNDERWELLDGVPYAMSSPSRQHQEISMRLSSLIWNYLVDKPCKVFAAPFDIRLNADTYDDTVVQPDIVVVCDESKLDDKGGVGAPDMVIEILSQSTAILDKVLKFRKYQTAGVSEYWTIDPDSKSLSVNILDNGKYTAYAYGSNDTVPVHILEGCVIDLAKVFA